MALCLKEAGDAEDKGAGGEQEGTDDKDYKGSCMRYCETLSWAYADRTCIKHASKK